MPFTRHLAVDKAPHPSWLQPLAAGLLALLATACAISPTTTLNADLDQLLSPPEIEGTRWGLIVSDLNGEVLLTRRADERYLPASNTKLFSTAAAFHWQAGLADMHPHLATEMRLEPTGPDTPPNLVLIGRGDTGLSDAPDCETRCLAALVQAVSEAGLAEIGDVIGDETWFPSEPWLEGWSWEDLQARYGTATSALVVNDNRLTLKIAPGSADGEPIFAAWQDGDAFYGLDVDAITVREGVSVLGMERLPGRDTVRLFGQLHIDEAPGQFQIGLETPARMAAWRLKQALVAEGITVQGEVKTRSRPRQIEVEPNEPESDDTASDLVETCTTVPESAPAGPETTVLARLPDPDFDALLTDINKISQNLYAEMIVRHLGRLCGDGTSADGLARITDLLDAAGIPETSYDFFDGSGMSVYNRVSPRAINTLLLFAAEQDWGTAWRDTFPIGGVDGSLERRFRGTALEGQIFAKTGTLRGGNALSGYMVSASGRTLAFSIIANDRPLDVRSATPFMDAALVRIAEAY